jgi:LPXTG-motif cell wall-anchored protein
MSKTVTSERKISADDLRNKIQSFQDGIQGKVDDKKNTLLTAGGVALLVLLILVFLLGKRNGRKKTTLVEIRRV